MIGQINVGVNEFVGEELAKVAVESEVVATASNGSSWPGSAETCREKFGCWPLITGYHCYPNPVIFKTNQQRM
jgi:hypothetical protein